MKKAKRLFAAFFAVATLFAAVALAACAQKSAEGVSLKESGEHYVVIEATATGGSLADGLAALQEAGALEYTGTAGQYGLFLESVNGYVPAEGEAFMIYTTLGEYGGAVYSNASWGTYEYGGKTLASAAYGADGLPLVEDALYVIVAQPY